MKKLANLSAIPSPQFTKEDCKQGLKDYREQLFDLQNTFYADKRFALLIIFQGMDTSGKDGTIRHTMTCMNPMGVNVKSFKKPTNLELSHDFLWRVYPHIPAKGMIQVFNRSYYEDLIVPKIDDTIPLSRLVHRFQLINKWEEHLMQSDIHVLKFFLHISKEKQKERIQERLIKPHKRWKYSKEDLISASKWDEYASIYDKIISYSSHQPWHIVPADKRWYRNYFVAKTLTEYLQNLDLKYPTSLDL